MFFSSSHVCALPSREKHGLHTKIEILRFCRFNAYARRQILLILTVFFALKVVADAPRERLLLDSSWRFQLGDPTDLTNSSETNVAYYPEIPSLPKLTTGEMTGATSETNLETLRPDPVATHLGENVSLVQTNFNDSAWQSINLPHDWVVALPFDSTADMGHGYKSKITGTTSPTTIGWYRHT